MPLPERFKSGKVNRHPIKALSGLLTNMLTMIDEGAPEIELCYPLAGDNR